MSDRYTVAVDFDGVIHSYTSPWVAPEHIPDPPVQGAFEWIQLMLDAGLDVVIFTTRGKTETGRQAVHSWLKAHWPQAPIDRLPVTAEKPPALAYLDDRAIRFNGPEWWPTFEQIMRARPWNKPALTTLKEDVEALRNWRINIVPERKAQIARVLDALEKALRS